MVPLFVSSHVVISVTNTRFRDDAAGRMIRNPRQVGTTDSDPLVQAAGGEPGKCAERDSGGGMRLEERVRRAIRLRHYSRRTERAGGIMLYSVAVLVLSTSLYVVLKRVDRNLALFATFSRLAYGLVWLLVVLNLFTALRLLSHAEYAGFPPDQLPVLARLYLSGFDQYYVGLLFWSLASGVGAYLWHKSRYIHRALAAFGVVTSAWCAVCTILLFIFPDFSKTVNLWWFDTPMVLFETVLSFLLPFRGLRTRGREAALGETHA